MFPCILKCGFASPWHSVKTSLLVHMHRVVLLECCIRRITCPPPLCVTGFPTQRNALLPRCLSWRQRSDDLEGLLQMAPLFVLWSVPCRIRTPLVWWDTVCGCSPSGHCPCAYTRVGSAYRSTQVLRNWIRFFRCRNVGTVRSRSCCSPVFRGMWN